MTDQMAVRSIVREKAFQTLYLKATRPNLDLDQALIQTLSSQVEGEGASDFDPTKEDLQALLAENLPQAYQSEAIVRDALVYLLKLTNDLSEQSQLLDETISQYLKKRSINRLEKANHIILQIGTYELLFQVDLAPSIVIDEAIELAKRFNDDQSSKFVNGVLQSVLNDREIQA